MTSLSKEQGISLHDLSLIAHTLSDKSLTIPFYEDIKASAGTGCTNDECELQYINLIPNMLPVKNTKNIEAILVSGDSMTGTINDNDVIFIDKNQTTPQNGKIFVILMCGEVYVKRVFIDPITKKLILKSDNALFPQFEASEDCKIIGRVVANMSIKEL
jgi:phage repressor protein C with HTH and peptisase S24 domain